MYNKNEKDKMDIDHIEELTWWSSGHDFCISVCVCVSLSGVVTTREREREEDEYEYDNSE